MPKFTPFPTGVPIRQDDCELVGVYGGLQDFSAVFIASGPIWVKVEFGSVLGYRVLEDMVYSVYGEKSAEGIVRTGFCYTAEDSLFLPRISELSGHYPKSWGPLRQFTLLSREGTLDVLTHSVPTFKLIDNPDGG